MVSTHQIQTSSLLATSPSVQFPFPLPTPNSQLSSRFPVPTQEDEEKKKRRRREIRARGEPWDETWRRGNGPGTAAARRPPRCSVHRACRSSRERRGRREASLRRRRRWRGSTPDIGGTLWSTSPCRRRRRSSRSAGSAAVASGPAATPSYTCA
jgi:hypothetical protein